MQTCIEPLHLSHSKTTVMKKKIIALFPVIILITFTGSAQFKKGMRMAEATIGSSFLNSGKSDYSFPPPTTGYTNSDNSFGISLNPSMGWFISDNVAVGALLNLGYNHDKSFDMANGNTFDQNISNNFNIGIGGFARNYFNTSGSMMPFGQFNLNFGIGSSSKNGFSYSNGNKYTYDGKSSGDLYVNTGLAGGFTKMLNDHTGLDFFAGYTFSFSKNTFKTTTLTDFGNNGTIDQTSVSEPTQKFTNHGFSIGIGFQIFLDKKNK